MRFPSARECPPSATLIPACSQSNAPALNAAMAKSATDVMHEIILSAVTDSIEALKSASKGMPNTLLREINSIHPNAAFADLPRELQAAITANVRAAFNRLLKEGYSVAQGQAAPPTRTHSISALPSGDRRPPRPSGRPSRKPKPGAPNKR